MGFHNIVLSLKMINNELDESEQLNEYDICSKWIEIIIIILNPLAFIFVSTKSLKIALNWFAILIDFRHWKEKLWPKNGSISWPNARSISSLNFVNCELANQSTSTSTYQHRSMNEKLIIVHLVYVFNSRLKGVSHSMETVIIIVMIITTTTSYSNERG